MPAGATKGSLTGLIPMSEPHTIGSPQQALLRVADKICFRYEGEAFSHFVMKALANNWDLTASREHIYYSLCELEWRLRPGLEVHPDRWFLATLNCKVGPHEYEQLHPSLQLA